ncbi:MAG: protein-L-isoaspartate(D-aspartate) O-methyltransferase [Planctomycetota bacterium]
MDRLDERRRMVREQIEARGISDPAVLAAMRTVPRHRFVPWERDDESYGDHAVPLSEGQTVSQPYIVALMTRMLRLAGTERVLEIGTGSGYQAAVLAEIVPRVFTIEVRPRLAESARTLLGGLGYRNIEYRCADGRLGWPEEAPFDAVLLTAAPAGDVPQALVDQLGEGGRLVAPVGGRTQQLVTIERRDGRLVRATGAGVRFVPLVHGESPRP